MKKAQTEDSKSQFFTNISHEFRTPLTLILGPLEDLISEIKDESQLKKLKSIRSNSHRLLELVNQLMDLAKTEAGMLTLSRNVINPKNFFAQLHSGFEQASLAKNISLPLVINCTKNLNVDVNKLQTCIFNLIGNALKFTPNNGSISTTVLEDGDTLIIKIQDSGIGIKPEKIPFIFDRYFQAEKYFPSPDGFIRNEPGTGVGLALCKTLVDLHEGEINVESEPGEGTTFIISIPNGLTTEAQPENQEIENRLFSTPPKEKDIEANEENDEDKPKILLVEDNADVRSYIVDILKADYSIQEAVNGRNALDLAHAEIPDIILSDVMMPEMDGLTFCKEIKENEFTSHIPLVLLTADSNEATKLTGLKSGADEFLLKPFNSNELKSRLKNLLEQKTKVHKKVERELFFNDKKVDSLDDRFLQKAKKSVELNLANEHFTSEDLCQEIGYSRTQAHRKLKAITGLSATGFVRSIRLNKAKIMLEQKSGSISEIAYSVGFSSPGYFTKSFVAQFGVKPSEVKF